MNKFNSFLASEYPQSDPKSASFYIIPCPMEKTVSYGSGTAQGPVAILEASQQLEALENGLAPGEYGFFTMPFIDCEGATETVLSRIEQAVTLALENQATPVLLGGEHTITLGALRALKHFYELRNESFGIVQFDAHADLRSQYMGDRLSHASVMRRAVEDLNLPLVQFATREICREEIDARTIFNITNYDAYFLARVGLPEKPLPHDFPANIYISFDLDAFDSSLMPATGTPSPGGINWREAHYIIENCAKDHKIIGCDVVELAPISVLHHADFTAAKLVHLLMSLVIAEKRK